MSYEVISPITSASRTTNSARTPVRIISARASSMERVSITVTGCSQKRVMTCRAGSVSASRAAVAGGSRPTGGTNPSRYAMGALADRNSMSNISYLPQDSLALERNERPFDPLRSGEVAFGGHRMKERNMRVGGSAAAVRFEPGTRSLRRASVAPRSETHDKRVIRGTHRSGGGGSLGHGQAD